MRGPARARPTPRTSAGRLLGIAAHHLEAGRVRLLLVGGAPGTGKSTIATALGTDLDAFVVRSDEVRKELAGLPSGAHAPAPPHDGHLRPLTHGGDVRRVAATALGDLLELGHSVVLDATWPTEALRHDAAALADVDREPIS